MKIRTQQKLSNRLTLPKRDHYKTQNDTKHRNTYKALTHVRKTTKIRKRYNQVPHLNNDTSWESNKNTINIANRSQEISPSPAGDHKAAMNRRKSTKNTSHKNDPQKKYGLEAVSKNILPESLNRFHGANLTLRSDVDQDT